MTGPIEFWHVRLPNGSVCTMTLDDLDDAFQNGKIDERTYVLKQGDTAWATLGALLGIDDAPAAPSVTPPPVVVAPISYPPPVSSVPIYSLRPVVSDLDDSDLDFAGPQFRSSKKRTAMIAGGVVGAALIAIAVATLGSSDGKQAPIATKQPAVTAAAAAPPPVVATPAPTDTAPAATDRLTDAQKRALADADKSLSAKQAAQQKARMNAAPTHHSSYKSDGKPVFHKGGDKHDPLNQSL
jgi:hypothetical protein